MFKLFKWNPTSFNKILGVERLVGDKKKTTMTIFINDDDICFLFIYIFQRRSAETIFPDHLGNWSKKVID